MANDRNNGRVALNATFLRKQTGPRFPLFEKWGTDAAEACLAAAPFSVADFREQHLRILILKLGVSDNVRARRRAFVDAFNNRIASEVRRG